VVTRYAYNHCVYAAKRRCSETPQCCGARQGAEKRQYSGHTCGMCQLLWHEATLPFSSSAHAARSSGFNTRGRRKHCSATCATDKHRFFVTYIFDLFWVLKSSGAKCTLPRGREVVERGEGVITAGVQWRATKEVFFPGELR
jgi:hypothetical protein